MLYVHSVQQHWDKKKTLKQNMSDLGLAYDANKVLPIPNRVGFSGKSGLESLEEMTVDEAKKVPSVASQKKKWVEGQCSLNHNVFGIKY